MVQVEKLFISHLLHVAMVFRPCFRSGHSCWEHGAFLVMDTRKCLAVGRVWSCIDCGLKSWLHSERGLIAAALMFTGMHLDLIVHRTRAV